MKYKLQNNNVFEYVLMILLFIDIFTKFIPIVPFFFVILLCQTIRVDYNSNVFLYIYFVSLFLGATLKSIGISGIGGFANILGACLLIVGIIIKKSKLKNLLSGGLLLLSLLIIYFLSMEFSMGGNMAGKKFILNCQNGLLAWLAFSILFSNLHKMNLRRCGLYLIIYGVFLLRLALITNKISGPENIFDFSFMRYQTIERWGYEPLFFTINYQFPGAFALQGVSIYVMSRNYNKLVTFMLILFSTIIALYAGARQSIVAAIIIILLWSLIKLKINGIAVGTLIVLAVLLSYTTFVSMNDLFYSTIHEGYIEGGGRTAWLMRGVDLFITNPIFGVGFGRYNLMGDYSTYPHNFILEILCELGVFGFFFIAFLVFVGLRGSGKYKHLYMYYLLVIILAGLASGGSYDNIVIFSFIFALPSLVNNKIVKYLYVSKRCKNIGFATVFR